MLPVDPILLSFCYGVTAVASSFFSLFPAGVQLWRLSGPPPSFMSSLSLSE